MNLSTIIVVVILAIILIPALKSTISHMKGEGDCCGGPKEKVAKKKIKGRKLYDLAIYIEGMHCDNCKNRITKKLNALDGITCQVSLAKKRALVSVYKEIDPEILIRTIENLDFTVVNMEKM